MCHSSFWPVEGIDMKGKKMAVVGNGATGIQIAQTAAREASELAVFVRTPNTCIPMNQGNVEPARAKKDLQTMGDMLGRQRYENLGGFIFSGQGKKLFDDDEETRNQVLDQSMEDGGFRILFQYDDTLTDEKANRYIYDRLTARTRARMTDKKKKDILAPLEPPHPFAGKRPSLEQGKGAHITWISVATNLTRLLRANGQIARQYHRPQNKSGLTCNKEWHRNQRRHSS